MMAGFRMVHAGVSDVGLKRKANEDSLVERPDINLWAVADGMGGHKNGRWASTTIAEALKGLSVRGEFDADVSAVADAIHAANRQIYQAGQAEGASMGSTVVALLLNGRRFAVLWAGDSRIYLQRGGELHRLTHDHTQVQGMVDAGLLTEAEAAHHPMSHVLTRAVGVDAELELDGVADEAEAGDVFLLCSDGLHGVVTEDEIGAALAKVQPAAAADLLLQLCLSRGAPDNVTIAVVACQEPTALTPGQPAEAWS